MKELLLETELQWSVEECQKAASVNVYVGESAVAVERFFLWRNDSLVHDYKPSSRDNDPNLKQWSWFSLSEAKRRSANARNVLESKVCKDLLVNFDEAELKRLEFRNLIHKRQREGRAEREAAAALKVNGSTSPPKMMNNEDIKEVPTLSSTSDSSVSEVVKEHPAVNSSLEINLDAAQPSGSDNASEWSCGELDPAFVGAHSTPATDRQSRESQTNNRLPDDKDILISELIN